MQALPSQKEEFSSSALIGLSPEFHRARLSESRRRSIEVYKLDPEDTGHSRVLPAYETRISVDRSERLLRASHSSRLALFRHVSQADYCVLLTDDQGVTLDVLVPDRRAADFRNAGLLPGACWSEQEEGTCAVGTAIVDQSAILVHQKEHFRVANSPITCSSVPIFSPDDSLLGVLDTTALQAPESRSSQTLIYRLLCHHAALIEEKLFADAFVDAWILHLAPDANSTTFDSGYRVAIDAGGSILGMSRALRRGGGSSQLHRMTRIEDLLECSAAELFLLANEHQGFPLTLRSPAFNRLVSVCLRPPVWLAGTVAAPSPAKAGPAGETLSADPARRGPSPTSRRGDRDALAALVTTDASVAKTVSRIRRLIDRHVPIMLVGETGTGKEAFARAIHQCSSRRDHAFVALNCAAIPESLIERELFGYSDRGDANSVGTGQKGKVQLSSEGTLFLDEIGDMPFELQSRLLRVLAQDDVAPVGQGESDRPTLSVICATHCDLQAMVQAGSFREDLYYRLNAAVFTLPPLRERTDLAEMIARLFDEENQLAGRAIGMSPELRQALLQHPWTGNVRELRNTLRVTIAMCDGAEARPDHLPDGFQAEEGVPLNLSDSTPGAGASLPAFGQRADGKRQLMLDALRRNHWNVSAAARCVGVSRSTLYRWMTRAGVVQPNRADTS